MCSLGVECFYFFLSKKQTTNSVELILNSFLLIKTSPHILKAVVQSLLNILQNIRSTKLIWKVVVRLVCLLVSNSIQINSIACATKSTVKFFSLDIVQVLSSPTTC